MGSSATVVLSLDAELRWGFHDHNDIPIERIRHARESWEYIITLFDEYHIPATWAVVGHLFLDACDGVHSDHPAGEDWFSCDTDKRHTPDSGWFGQDLINAIYNSEVDHDIGAHTFSHIEFGKQGVSRDVAEAELRYSASAAEDYGVDLKSFVFPRNNIGHRGLLAKHGFRCYRGASPERWYNGKPLRQVGKLATFAFGTTPPPIVTPEIERDGIVNVPASLYLFTFDGSVRDAIEAVTGDPVLRQVELGLEKLRERKQGILHLWFHPNNITTTRDRHRLKQLISMIAEYQNNSGIKVETMSQVADRVKANE